jgi:DNA polymerase-3 subunit delta'
MTSLTEIHPWNKAVWDNLIAKSESGRKPHALLFCGAYGLGKRALAEAYSRHVLLDNEHQDSSATGNLFEAGTHPDMHVLMSESSVDTQPDTIFAKFAVRYLGERGARKPKQVISVAQIRSLGQSILSTTASHGSRVVVLPDASAMNTNAANSLLKNLEEPPGETVFLLLSDKPESLPATIRSRCTPIYFRCPSSKISQNWLQGLTQPEGKNTASRREEKIDNVEDLLAFAGGAPLLALALHQTGDRERHSNLLRQLCDVLIGKTAPLGAAKIWHEEAPELIIRLTQQLFSDLIRCRVSEQVEPAFYKAQKQWLHRQGNRLNSRKLFLMWQKTLKTAQLMAGTSDKLLIIESLAFDLANAGKTN